MVYGGNPCVTLVLICHLPCLVQPLYCFVELVEAVNAEWWWVWQDYQSLPTCPLHQQTIPLHVAGGGEAIGDSSHSFHSPKVLGSGSFSQGGHSASSRAPFRENSSSFVHLVQGRRRFPFVFGTRDFWSCSFSHQLSILMHRSENGMGFLTQGSEDCDLTWRAERTA